MGGKTRIDWCDATWNVIEGCSPVGAGCANCYAGRTASRFAGPDGTYDGLAKHGRWNGRTRLREDRLEIPLRWKRPRVIFACSMGDLFHPTAPADFIQRVFDVMAMASQHIFLVLTKRPEAIGPVLFGQEGGWYLGGGDYLPNVWLGTSVENIVALPRVADLLRGADQFHTFLSMEPLLESVPIDPFLGKVALGSGRGIEWVIVGGEKGPGFRPMDTVWAERIRRDCKRNGVPFFFKQQAGRINPAKTLGGRIIHERPSKIQEVLNGKRNTGGAVPEP